MAGSWWTLINLQQEHAQWLAYERSRTPPACPNDGEPLQEGPDGVRFCRVDGWQFPRDYVRPCERPCCLGVLPSARAPHDHPRVAGGSLV